MRIGTSGKCTSAALPRMWRLSLAWPPTVRLSISLVPRER